MKHRVKAAPAGSIEGTGASRGFLRRALATRGRLSDADGSGAPSSRRTRFALAPLLAVLALLALALSASAALAAQTHVFTGSFGSEGSGAGQLNEPIGLAVDQVAGDVYVADTGNNRVDKFDPFGTFLRAFIGGLPTGAAA